MVLGYFLIMLPWVTVPVNFQAVQWWFKASSRHVNRTAVVLKDFNHTNFVGLRSYHNPSSTLLWSSCNVQCRVALRFNSFHILHPKALSLGPVPEHCSPSPPQPLPSRYQSGPVQVKDLDFINFAASIKLTVDRRLHIVLTFRYCPGEDER